MFEQKNKEIRSLNEGLPVLYAEELEVRLETDPLGISNLFDQIAEINDDSSQSRINCNDYCKSDCTEYCNDCDHCGTYCEDRCGQNKKS